MKFEPVIGLEIHVELLTKTKIFCGCSNTFGSEPNSQTCPVCLGLPGSRPLLNKQAVEFAIKASLALNCEIAEYTTFDRKNYFYADLPKGYQISQYFYPTGTNGYVDINVNGDSKRVRIHQLHLEEDTGKLLHSGSILDSPYSRVDFNRAGVPLIEIVTEPDIRSAEEARVFLQKLRTILLYTEVSDCKMEEGSMRCDANISIRPEGSKVLGSKTELKNMNSFKAVQKGIEYEIKRQTKVLEAGSEVVPETRHWNEGKGTTTAMRSKFKAANYRCFPDPNVFPIENNSDWIENIKNHMPELPDEKKARFVADHNLPQYDAEVLTSSSELAEFYDRTVSLYPNPKFVSNWVMGELIGLLNAKKEDISACKITPSSLARLFQLIDDQTISGKIAKTVFQDMFDTGKDPETIVKEKNLVQITDTGEIEVIVDQVIEANPGSVADFKGGKKKALGFLVGQIMKATKGQANPQVVNKLLAEKLK
ncbi:Asp-tRNA(Asn)/Glu-tRNA(Gln) amidotransferase subunit GatB [Candidatus Contubernalis alkaliaceticus]|uniref:Asp-tRNA(Asn)/Glu-tRNA(Gln) amidotransferase subunit GatB n=1 Tax=Candidatus Contubernalis alkaliaceticus TaxID=338645 RepID=UPI001F4C49A8|nr:Asp-tRNA(Asn)/Glu-tRNA(Gln) amidotransferase subunit GatB [Candidatus Contubernalis alkalaceticus]UNC91492.1 Asp-tRNA(Asn)/Glu-tRNA(Gln) amidotransferase subunit GatB [Candidatus Contubernalis alkalaceticus]